MTSINNSVDITFLPANRSEQTSARTAYPLKNGNVGGSPKENQSYPPQVVNDTLSQALKNLQVVNNIKDTTGAILAAMQAQMEGKGFNLANLNQANVTSKSLQVGQAIALLGAQGLVQTNQEILRQFQG
jgi:hypothetical protein